MKKVVTYFLFLFIIGTSCQEGFLEEEPISFLTSDAIYNTREGLEAALNGCYTQLSAFAGFGAGYPTLVHIGSGGFYTTQGPAQDLNTLTFGGSNVWLDNNSPWDAFYTAINSANTIIDKAQSNDLDGDFENQIIAEAHFLRGMLYFNLVRMFGDLPLRLTPVNSENLYLPRTPKSEVYSQIIADLDFAKNNMPEPGTNLSARPHRFAADALLGKVYITLAGNDSNSPYWQNAKESLLKVVNSGAYQLEPTFQRLFDVENENNLESIFEVQYTLSGGPNSQLTNYYSPRGSQYTPKATTGPFGRNRVNKDIFDKHVAVYPDDPRVDLTFIHTNFTRNGGSVKVYPSPSRNEGFPYIKKYVDPNFVSSRSNRNFFFLRYADVLLMLAEAENEINGPDAAYTFVNQVLERARNSAIGEPAEMPMNWENMTQDEFRERILLERRFELIGECHLYFDVRRRGVDRLFEFLKSHNEHPSLDLTIDVIYPLNERLMLFPIPDKEINANPNINPEDQNPGY